MLQKNKYRPTNHHQNTNPQVTALVVAVTVDRHHHLVPEVAVAEAVLVAVAEEVVHRVVVAAGVVAVRTVHTTA